MTYIEGFVIAVPTANRQKFIDHAHLGDTVFMEHGATRVVECWEEDVPKGKINDFFGAVASREDESIVFSRSEEHTSELQSLMRISYAVFCLKKKKKNNTNIYYTKPHLRISQPNNMHKKSINPIEH